MSPAYDPEEIIERLMLLLRKLVEYLDQPTGAKLTELKQLKQELVDYLAATRRLD